MSRSWSQFFTSEGLTLLRRSIRLALDEDGPDLTAEGLFPPDAPLHAVIRAKEDTLVVGLPIIPEVIDALGGGATFTLDVEEAARVPAMTTVARLHGPAVLLLRAERVILNFITHLSGIANLTARYVQELEGTGVRLLDTRKTTPGLRWPEKYAVQAGGGCNHRKNLVEMLMLKDNHIDAAGSIGAAVRQLRERYSPCPPIEVECRTLDHVRAALDAGADRIMMDNMDSPCSRRRWRWCRRTWKPKSAAACVWKPSGPSPYRPPPSRLYFCRTPHPLCRGRRFQHDAGIRSGARRPQG